VGRGVRRWRSRLPKARCRSELKKGGALRRLRAAGSFHTGAARVLPQGARSIARRRSWGTVISPPRGSCGTPATLRRSSARRAPLHSRDATYARFCQGPYEESIRYRDFMGWEMPWYSAAQDSLDTLLVGRRVGMMHIVCCVDKDPKSSKLIERRGAALRRWTTDCRLLDLIVYGRQETWEDPPTGWPQRFKRKQHIRINGRPTAQ
jgi:Bacterial protein of unknown function (DUF899)